MTYDELKKLRQQLSAEPVTVDEFFRRHPTSGTVVFKLPDISDPSKYREGTCIGLYLSDQSPIPEAIASMTVIDVDACSVTGMFLTLFVRKESVRLIFSTERK